MDREKIIELLNKDVEDEHGAIIQYLSNAYGMGEGEMACEIEAVSRDEMRHLDWLAETIVELGGVPSLERGTMRMGDATVPDWMKNDVLLEEGAIAQYRQHIKLIDDPTIKRLLRRIQSDEEAHHLVFQHLVDKTRQEGTSDIRGERSDDTTQTLNRGIEHEYTVILQYMLHSYLTPNVEAKKQFEDQAINEMQHMGWLAERLVDMSSSPTLEHHEVDRSTTTADMLHVDIKVEKEVAEVYDRAADETDDPDVKRLLKRLRDHETYHAEVFSDVLAAEEQSG